LAGKRPTPAERSDRASCTAGVEVFYRDGKKGLGRFGTALVRARLSRVLARRRLAGRLNHPDERFE